MEGCCHLAAARSAQHQRLSESTDCHEALGQSHGSEILEIALDGGRADTILRVLLSSLDVAVAAGLYGCWGCWMTSLKVCWHLHFGIINVLQLV